MTLHFIDAAHFTFIPLKDVAWIKVTRMAFRTKGKILTSNIYVHFSSVRGEKNTGDTSVLIFYYYCLSFINKIRWKYIRWSSGYAKLREYFTTSMMIYYALSPSSKSQGNSLDASNASSVRFSNRGFALSSLNFLSFYVAACLFILHPRLEAFFFILT